MSRHTRPKRSGVNRRQFLKTSALAGASLAVGARAFAAAAGGGNDLNVAVIGAGTQGRVLLTNSLKIPGVRFKAVCDIWPYYKGYAQRLLKAYKHEANAYGDHQEMLAAEKDLDAVIVATPDWVHAEQAVACMKAGLHVYCEKEMSNSAEKAREMVAASKATGKLLQIGHQRRSNPRYHTALDYIDAKKALGRMTFVSGQWNRHQRLNVGWPDGKELDAAILETYGYGTMERFRNWRWYRKFSGGPIADLGSHQIDIFHWFLHARPTGVVASGGLDYHDDIEWYDNINALYEWQYAWEGETKTVRGFYQTLSTTSHGGFAETFMGTDGSLIISEYEGIGGLRREQTAPVADWEKPLLEALGKQKEAAEAAKEAAPTTVKTGEGEIEIGHSVPMPGRYYPPIPALEKPAHLPHLENFFAAVRGEATLTCPGEVGLETCVSVLKVNEAVAQGKPMTFDPAEFTA